MESHRQEWGSPSETVQREGLGKSIAVLRGALAILGIRTEETSLAGLSGAAFRTYWPAAQGDLAWDPDVPLRIRHDPLSVACLAHGWRLLWYRGIAPSLAWQLSRQSLARGVPVLTRIPRGGGMDVLIVGCARLATDRLLLTLINEAKGIEGIEARVAWPGHAARGVDVGLLAAQPSHRRVAWDNAVHHALRRAVWMFDEGQVYLPPLYCSGNAAFAAAASALRGGSDLGAAASVALQLCAAHGIPPPGSRQSAAQLGIRHCLHRWTTAMAEARRWAAAFCRSVSGQAAELAEAARCYEIEAGIWESLAPLWPRVVQGSGRGARAVAPLETDAFASMREHAAQLILEAGRWNGSAVQAIRSSVPPVPQEMDGEANEEDAGDGIDPSRV